MKATPRPPLSEDLASPHTIGGWPFGLLVVAALRLIDAVSLAAVGLAFRGLPMNGLPLLANHPELTRAIDLSLAAITIVGVVGLLARRRWGWVLTVVLVGVELAIMLIRVAIGRPDFLGLAILVVTAFYLNQRSVRDIARQHPDHPALGAG